MQIAGSSSFWFFASFARRHVQGLPSSSLPEHVSDGVMDGDGCGTWQREFGKLFIGANSVSTPPHPASYMQFKTSTLLRHNLKKHV
jgi:hypothetical protein